MTNLKDLLAALTEEERDAILEHDADSRLGRLVLECLKPTPVKVPYWVDGEVALQQNSAENLLLYLKTPLTGEVIYPKTALKLARALVVGAMALEGVELQPQQPNDIRPHIDAKGCAKHVTLYLDGLLARLDERN